MLTEEARREQVDGVICGHIHHAVIEHFDDVTYVNTGDWVESCTAVVEHFDGTFEILHWPHVLVAVSAGFTPRLIEGATAEAA